MTEWHTVSKKPIKGQIVWAWDGTEMHMASFEHPVTKEEFESDNAFFGADEVYEEYVASAIDSGWMTVTAYGDVTREIHPLLWTAIAVPETPVGRADP